jgi:hypothetical protein
MEKTKASIDCRALWLSAAVILLASFGGPAAAAEEPHTSVKNLTFGKFFGERYKNNAVM